VRRWALWGLPPALICYSLVLVATATGLMVAGLPGTPLRRADLLTWAPLLTGAMLCIELTHRQGQPAGFSRDLLSAWKIPAALLLPPVYALLTPVPLVALQHVRVRSGLVHRRVASAAAVGIADAAGSLLFHRLLPAGLTPAGWFLRHPVPALVGAIGAALLCTVVNILLMAVAADLSSPAVHWWSVLWNRESLTLDLGEISAGVLIASACVHNPAVAIVAVPPVWLLHRSLGHAQLWAAARTDAKTGLLNAATWQVEAELEIVRATREGRPLAILIADLDRFKQVNDTHGHLVGDRVLAAVATALRCGLRPYDVAGRFGGEEFTVALPNTDQEEAVRIAERLRRDVAGLLALDTGGTVQVTISVGAAVLGTHGSDLIDLLAAADVALYCAKAAGRNQVAIAAA
jgi:diguanylate cyclase (GGDEF)-like protein